MRLPAPTGADWKTWAEDVRRSLERNGSKLDALDATASAAQDGIVLFDRSAGVPVYSTGGAFVPFGSGAPGSGSFVLDDGTASAGGVFTIDDGGA